MLRKLLEFFTKNKTDISNQKGLDKIWLNFATIL
jgi:hypothetical protein